MSPTLYSIHAGLDDLSAQLLAGSKSPAANQEAARLAFAITVAKFVLERLDALTTAAEKIAERELTTR